MFAFLGDESFSACQPAHGLLEIVELGWKQRIDVWLSLSRIWTPFLLSTKVHSGG